MTLDELLLLCAEDVPEVAPEVQRIIRFRQAHRIHIAQVVACDAHARFIQQYNQSARKGARMEYA